MIDKIIIFVYLVLFEFCRAERKTSLCPGAFQLQTPEDTMDLFETLRVCHGNRSLRMDITPKGTVIVPIGTKLEDGRWTVHRGDEEIGYFTVENGVASKATKKGGVTPEEKTEAMFTYILDGEPREVFAKLTQIMDRLSMCDRLEALIGIGELIIKSENGAPCPDCGEVHEPLPSDITEAIVREMRGALLTCSHGHVLTDELTRLINGSEEQLRTLGYSSRTKVANQRDRLRDFLTWANLRVPLTVNHGHEPLEA